MIKCILFDLDDTLCNYSEAANLARSIINTKLEELSLSTEKFWELYNKLNESLYKSFTTGSLDRDEYRRLRFEAPLSELHVKSKKNLSTLFNEIFMNETNSNINLFEDALPVLIELQRNGMMLVLLTNGPADGQRIKIRHLEISKYFNHIIISEEFGYAKPNPRVYQHVLAKTDLRSTQVLAVGDSIEYDIRGAESVSMPHVLLDRYEQNQSYQGRRINGLRDLLVAIAELR